MTAELCQCCKRSLGDGPDRVPDGVVTRGQLVHWMRESGDSAADFYEAVATFFGIESEEIEAP